MAVRSEASRGGGTGAVWYNLIISAQVDEASLILLKGNFQPGLYFPVFLGLSV